MADDVVQSTAERSFCSVMNCVSSSNMCVYLLQHVTGGQKFISEMKKSGSVRFQFYSPLLFHSYFHHC